MSVREQGLRRVAAVTTGLAAVSIAGSLAFAAVARAGTRAADTSTGGSNAVDQSHVDSGTDTGSQTGPRLSNGDGPAHARSGGS